MKNIIRLFLLLFSLSAFAQVPQTGGSGGGSTNVRYGISTPTILGTDKKGDEYFRTITGDNTVSASESYLYDGTQWTVRPTTPYVGDWSSIVRYSAGTNTDLSTITSTATSSSGTLLTLANRVTFVGGTVQGNMVVGGASGSITVAKTGDYSIIVIVGIQSAGTTGQYGQLTKNNNTLLMTSPAYSQTNSAGMQIIMTYRGSFVAGDVIDARINSTASGTIGVTSYSYNIGQESGYLPVSGQSGDYFSVVRNTSQTVALGTDILFNTTPIGNLAYNPTTGLVTLLANKRYKIKAKLTARNDGTGTTGRYIIYAFYNELNVQYINGTRIDGTHFLSTSTLNEAGNTEASITLETNSDIQIKVRINGIDGSNWTLDGDRCKLEIEQAGTNVFSFPVTSASIVNGVTNTANTGTSFTANVGFTQVNPASLVSAMTITLPPSPALGDKVQLLFGGTIGANQPVITTPTIAPNSGQSIYGNITFTQAKGGDEIEYTYISANNWFRTK